jgi:hypothetical protein
MKIISIKQPWASLIIDGARNVHTGSIDFKDIENRDWRTHHRGPTLIHASLRYDHDGTDADTMRRRFGIELPKRLPQGGIIGVVDIVDCVEDHHSKWFVGRYGFVLENRRRIRFERWPGRLGVREAPRALLAKLKSERRPS